MIDEGNNITSIATPPLNLLFNTSLLGKQNVWEINISKLLELLLKIINSSGKKGSSNLWDCCMVIVFNISLKG